MLNQEFLIRPIQPADNPAVAQIIRSVMTEFGAVGPGFSINDPEVDTIFEAYSERACYLVVEHHGEIVGGGGVAQLLGGDADTCELKKMYFYPVARGRGLGEQLLGLLLKKASEIGFRKMYLESQTRMQKAIHLYERMGFLPLPGHLGCTGHSSCNAFYLRDL